MDVKIQVKKLLLNRQDNLSTLPCLALFDDGEAVFGTTRPIPISQVKDIYRMRAHLNERKGCPIAGFDELLNALETSCADQVCVHSLTKYGQMCVVFTDASVEKLFGVLIKPAIKYRPEPEIFAASAA